MEERAPLLSFVIPAYNEEAYIAQCVRAIEEEIERGHYDAEIIVVNNASTDNTEKAASGFPHTRVVYEQAKGLTHARQRGLKESRGEWIANIDADIRMRPGWMKHVLDVIRSDERIVCVSGPHIYDELPAPARLAVWVYWLAFAMPTYKVVGYMVQGGNFVAKKDALIKIGGYDTNIAFYGEDTNIARRLAKVGRVVFRVSCYNFASARRIKAEGMLLTAFHYVSNFLGEVFLKRPVKSTYKDFR